MKITSPIEICNTALGRIGQRTISSLKDDSPQAKACELFYEQTKSRLLASYSWTFATDTVTLRKVSDNSGLKDTDAGYDTTLLIFLRKYAKPPNCLTVNFITGSDNFPLQNNEFAPVFVNEGNFIKTDLPICKMNYIKDIDNVTEFSPQFKDCLKLAIAIEIGKTFVDSQNYVEGLKAEFEREFLKAKINDMRQTMPYSGKPEYLNYVSGGF